MRKMILKLRLGLLFATSVALLTGTLSAAPFDKQISFKQPDGTMIELHGWGDEFSAVFETLDGYTVVFDQGSQAYCFARQDDSGKLASMGVQAHLGVPAGLAKHERMTPAERKAQIVARWQQWDAQMQVQARWHARLAAQKQVQYGPKGQVLYSPPGFTTTGTKLGLTLLVDFSDDPSTIPQAEIINFCNGDNYTGYGNNGSVKRYYYDNSGGQLTYSNVVTIYIRVPEPKTYYNDTSKDCGDQGNILIKDALDALKANPDYTTLILPTFNDLTVDGNGEVVACNVFYAGGNGGVWMYGLWPHSWSLYNVGAQSLGNGKSVFKYQITDIGSSLTLGTFCHENGHMLCDYPDIYDYGYDSIGGAGVFCLMNSGGHGGNPAQICAYLKRASGWGTTVELDVSSALLATARTAATTGTNDNQFYRYQKPGVPTEYFLIENRQKRGRDATIAASGLAIWHVDELGNKDNQNTNFNTTHANYEVSLVQADNQYHFQKNINAGDANDLYYASNTAPAYINEFTDASNPNAFWWDGTASGLRITTISPASNVMTFAVGTGLPSTTTTPAKILPPTPPWGTNLNLFTGANPNGDWLLFVQDDAAIGTGIISNGWFITLTTANPVGSAADVAVGFTPAGQTNVVGGQWSCQLTVTNYGPSFATNVVVTESLPVGLNLIPPSGAISLAGTNLVWNVGNLPVNAGTALALRFTLPAAGYYSQSAVVTSASDPNPDDDAAIATVMVFSSVATPVLSSPVINGSGEFQFSVSGNDGFSAVVQASTNLVSWVNVYTNICPFVYTNTAASDPQSFYRIVVGQ